MVIARCRSGRHWSPRWQAGQLYVEGLELDALDAGDHDPHACGVECQVEPQVTRTFERRHRTTGAIEAMPRRAGELVSGVQHRQLAAMIIDDLMMQAEQFPGRWCTSQNGVTAQTEAVAGNSQTARFSDSNARPSIAGEADDSAGRGAGSDYLLSDLQTGVPDKRQTMRAAMALAQSGGTRRR